MLIHLLGEKVIIDIFIYQVMCQCNDNLSIYSKY